MKKNKQVKDKVALVEDIRQLVRSSIGSRAKESLIIDFINQANLDQISDKASILEAFYAFARIEQKREMEELIEVENLNKEDTRRYISTSLRQEFASENGTELKAIMPNMSQM